MPNKKFFLWCLLAFGACNTVARQSMHSGDSSSDPHAVIVDIAPSASVSDLQSLMNIARNTEHFIRDKFVIASGAAGDATRCVDAAAYFATATGCIIDAMTAVNADVAGEVVAAAIAAAGAIDFPHIALDPNKIVRDAAKSVYAARDADDAILARLYAGVAANGVVAAARFVVTLVRFAVDSDLSDVIELVAVDALRSVRAAARAFDLNGAAPVA